MRADRTLMAWLVVSALAAFCHPVSAAPDVAAADEAFDGGDSARALSLYDEVIAAEPGNVHALLRSGMLLSWDKKYDEALDRYDRALTREPKNTQVLLERGKVLLWSKRYDEAVESFRRVLDVNPRDPWALCGTGQAFAWRGRQTEARPYFVRALEADPDLKEARLGLAYADLEAGDASAAAAGAAALEAKYPNDPEVAELRTAVRQARAPWIQAGYAHMDDSDENRMNTYTAEGGLALPGRLDLRFGYLHDDLHGPVPGNADANGTVESLYGVLGWQPKPRQRGELRLGAAQLTDSVNDERTTAIGGFSYQFPMASWSGRAALAYDPLLYSPQILDNAIDITSATFSASGRAVPRVQVETGAGYGDFSDGNARWNADAGAWYVWSWPKRTLLVGGVVRYLTFTEDLSDGYFDPSNLVAGLGSLRSNGAIGSSRWEYEALAEAGVQAYTFHGDKNSGKPLWNLYGLLAHPLARGLTFQLDATWGNSSTASGPGFKSLTFGARLRYAFGGAR